jgi:hypothetical protein
MPLMNPFWRACVLALAWCLVGLGIDPGPDAVTAPTPPAANAQRVAWVRGEFATDRHSHCAAISTSKNSQ